MSDSKETKLLTVKIQPSDELVTLITGHRDELAHTRAAIELRHRMSERIRSRNITGGLLAAMAGEAANDASESELLQMGQWVFEGQPEEFVTAHVNSFGAAAISSMPIGDIEPSTDTWSVKQDAKVTTPTCLYRALKGKFNTTNWQGSAISRQPVNDVDYLSETTPEMQGMDACDIIIDEVGRNYSSNSNCLHAVVPQITQADMQLIFIKNLSDVLIQRMHSMGRFSEDDDHVGGDKLMPWDIVIDGFTKNIGLVMGGPKSKDRFTLCFITPAPYTNHTTQTHCWEVATVIEREIRTITKDELSAFRRALEACYA